MQKECVHYMTFRLFEEELVDRRRFQLVSMDNQIWWNSIGEIDSIIWSNKYSVLYGCKKNQLGSFVEGEYICSILKRKLRNYQITSIFWIIHNLLETIATEAKSKKNCIKNNEHDWYFVKNCFLNCVKRQKIKIKYHA